MNNRLHFLFHQLMVTGILGVCLLALSTHIYAGAAPDQVAVVYVYPSDAGAAAVWTQAEMEEHFDGPIRDFWLEQSYGRYDIEVTTFVWRLPIDSSVTTSSNGHYVIDMLNSQLPDAGNFVIPGYDPTQYSKTMVLLGGGIVGFGGGFGSADIRVNGVLYENLALGSFTYLHHADQYYRPYLQFSYFPEGTEYQWGFGEVETYPALGLRFADGTLLHEWGHGLGLSTHANYWRSEEEPFYGEIYWRGQETFWSQTRDYGNQFDIMGGSDRLALHINAFYKDLLGWFSPDEKLVVESSTQDIRIHPLAKQTHGLVKVVQIPIASGQFSRPAPFDDSMDYEFNIEYRRGMGLDAHLNHDYLKSNTDGLMVTMNRSALTIHGEKAFINSWLLDMSPDGIVYDPSPTFIESGNYNRDDHHEASLNANVAFYDEETGVSLTHIRPDGDAGVVFNVGRGTKTGVPSGVHAVAMGLDDVSSSSLPGLLYSTELEFRLEFRADGQLVVAESATGADVWRGTTKGVPVFLNADAVALTASGLELRGPGGVLWSSGTVVPPDALLKISDSGELNIVEPNGNVLWPPGPMYENGFESAGS